MGIAYGGLLHLTGYPDRPPVRPGVTDLGLPDRRLRRGGRRRRPVPPGPARRGHRDVAAWSTPRCTAPSCASSSGRLPAQDRHRPHPPARGQPPGQLGPARQLPDGRRTLRLRRGRLRRQLLAGCARPWTGRTCRRPAVDHAGQAGRRSDEINDIVAEWTAPLTAEEVEARCIAHERARGHRSTTRPTSSPTRTSPPGATWSRSTTR